MGDRNSTERLATFALGGCGFYSTDENQHLETGDPIRCLFEIENRPNCQIEIQGNIVYHDTFKNGDEEMTYYGIQFLPAQLQHAIPIVDILERALTEGRVTLQ